MSANKSKSKGAHLLTAREMAKQLDVHWQTVLRWARQQTIPCERGGANYVRFDLEAVREKLRLNGGAA